MAAPGPRYARSKYHVWAALLERTFALDILSCSDCGGRLRFIATINDSSVIDKILSHLGLPTEAPRPAPAKVAGWLPGSSPPPTGSRSDPVRARVRPLCGSRPWLAGQRSQKLLDQRFFHPV